MDPHVWLSPVLMKQQAETIRDALVRLDPAGEATYDENLAALRADLDALDARIRGIFAGLEGRRVYVFHPAYGYFTAEYGLEQVAVEQAGKSPGARYLAGLTRQARADGIDVIFVQPQFGRRSAEVVARAIGGRVVTLDPLPERYVEGLELLARRVAAALRGEPVPDTVDGVGTDG
jgi:zinc transport system substrate-binding protein